MRNFHPVGAYRRPMPTVLGGSYGGGLFLTIEVPLHEGLNEHGTTAANVACPWARRSNGSNVIPRRARLIRKRTPLGPYRRPMPRVLEVSDGDGRFFYRPRGGGGGAQPDQMPPYLDTEL